MITLNQAIKVLDIQDHTIIWLIDDIRKPSILGKSMSVKKIKETFDLNKVYVTHIEEEHDRYDGTFYGYTFVIRDRRN
jgi:hypothetical protein